MVVLPDSGERYLSSVLFEDLFDAAGLPLASADHPMLLPAFILGVKVDGLDPLDTPAEPDAAAGLNLRRVA